jgi:hypothetical protein
VRQAELEDPDAWVAAQGETCGIGGPGRATECYLKGLTPELGTRVAHQFSAQERTDNDNFIECRSDARPRTGLAKSLMVGDEASHSGDRHGQSMVGHRMWEGRIRSPLPPPHQGH